MQAREHYAHVSFQLAHDRKSFWYSGAKTLNDQQDLSHEDRLESNPVTDIFLTPNLTLFSIKFKHEQILWGYDLNSAVEDRLKWK